MRFDYECSKEECGFLFEVEQPLKARKLRRCPVCGKSSLERVILAAPLGFVRGDVTTVGQLAERNAKAMGAEAVELEKKHLIRQEEFARKSRMENLRKKMPAGAKLLDY